MNLQIYTIVLLVLTIVNYLIGAVVTEEFRINRWTYQWCAFILSEVVIVITSIGIAILTHKLIQLAMKI